ncbi:MAG: DUF1048 domain-containing protein [Propionibacteriaceae bacterium]|nr:DUF1048 domain-containing protein [Propionibacteriaceae bacterium]
MIDKIRGFYKDTKVSKQAWRGYRARVESLPDDYRFVMEQIQKFLFNVAMDAQSVTVLQAILELFEEGVAAHRPVLEVTGDDVAGFARDVMTAIQAQTWAGKMSQQLNDRVAQHFGR